MPVNLVPVDALPANLSTFADGDALSQANFVANMQEFSDYLLYLKNRAVPTTGLTIPVVLQEPASNGGPGSFDWNGAQGGWNESAGAGDTAIWPVALMPTRTGAGVTWQLVEIIVWTINLTGHGGVDPNVDQSVSLDYTRASDGAIVNVAAFSDPSAAAALDVVHSFTSGALAHSLLDDVTYVLSYTGESGLGSQVDTVIKGVFFYVEPV